MECKNLLVELETASLEEHLSPAAVAHLDQCAHCSGLMADLKAIQAASVELREAEPPQRLWVSLRNQLESEGLIREAEAEVAFTASRPSLWMRLRPALAAAYLGILVVLGTWIGAGLAPTFPTGPDTFGAVVKLPDTLIPAAAEGTAPSFRERNPEVAASYTKSIEIIDNFIRLCEKTVRKQPNNEVAREYLYDAYQQKAGLLAMTMERGAWGD